MDNHSMDITQILRVQANRYPMLFIDKVEQVAPGKSSTCIKNFTYNEWFFPTHYDDDPNAPGFVLIESMVQSFLISFLTLEGMRGERTSFLNVEKASFRKRVLPGDSLKIESSLTSFKRGIAKGRSQGFVDGTFCCEAEFVVGIQSIIEKYRPSL